MRATLSQREVAASPGQSFAIEVEVSNTGDVIDSISVAVTGLTGASATTSPRELPLFPGTSGTIVVSVTLPKGFVVGRHEAQVEARAQVTTGEVAYCDFLVEVAPVTLAALSVSPLTRTGHRSSHFSVSVDNLGNTDLEVALQASDPERALRLSFSPDKAFITAASSADVDSGRSWPPPHLWFGTFAPGNDRRDGATNEQERRPRPPRGESHLQPAAHRGERGVDGLDTGRRGRLVGGRLHFRDQRHPGSAVAHQIGSVVFFCAYIFNNFPVFPVEIDFHLRRHA